MKILNCFVATLSELLLIHMYPSESSPGILSLVTATKHSDFLFPLESIQTPVPVECPVWAAGSEVGFFKGRFMF